MPKQFEGGSTGARDKLNDLQLSVDSLLKMRGDDVFINVVGGKSTPFFVRFNIQAVLSRIPKQWFQLQPSASAPTEIWVKVTGNIALGGNQWTYTGTQYNRSLTGWIASTPPMTFNGILNSMEFSNVGGTTPGVLGNGVNHTTVSNGGTFPNGYSMQPIATGAIVRMTVEDVVGGTAYTMCEVNEDDGGCS